jgi:hypothetical protein
MQKKTKQEKHFVCVQVLNFKKLNLKNTDIAKTLNTSASTVTRIVSSSYFKELRILDNLNTSELSESLSRQIFSLQSRIIELGGELIDKVDAYDGEDKIDMLIKALNILCKFCNHTTNNELRI